MSNDYRHLHKLNKVGLRRMVRDFYSCSNIKQGLRSLSPSPLSG